MRRTTGLLPVLMLALLVPMLWWTAAGPASASTVISCPVPVLPVAGCPVPESTASPEPSPGSPSPSPRPAATTAVRPAPTAAPTAAPRPSDTSAAVPAPLLARPPVLTGVVVVAPAASAPRALPQVAPAPIAAAPVLAGRASVTAAPPAAGPAAVAPLSGVVASSFAIVVGGLLVVPLLLSYLAQSVQPVPSARPARPAGPSHPAAPTSGVPMSATPVTRRYAGLAFLGAAAVVGGLGWYRLSGEPLLNRQIPFLASAGILVVILSVVGGSLLVAEQLRTDTDRIGDLEEAVRRLTEALAPQVELPPRVAPAAPEVEAAAVATPVRRRAKASSV